jgi:predicted O-methyltransferase YrrM
MDTAPANPGDLFEISGYYWKTCTLHTGVKLEVFTLIDDQEKAADEIAGLMDGDPRAVAMLLNALAAMGLLEKKEGRFANTPTARTFLSKTSERYIGYMIMHHHHLVESWAKLDVAVKTGQPVRTDSTFADDERRESFLMGMFNMAMGIAPTVARDIALGDKARLLDLGGGPGTYAIHFCLANPQLTATIFDLPTTRPFAEKTVARFNVSDRISFEPGSYLTDDIPGRYDAAWLSHILHGEGPADCQEIIRKTVSVLEPGGLIMIHEFILDNTMDGPLFPALFALNMLQGTEAGQSYSQAQLAEMLKHAGARDIERLPFKGPTESGILIARV